MRVGLLVTADVKDVTLDSGKANVIDVTGLADIAPEGPELEFVDTNTVSGIVVTRQKTNCNVAATKSGVIGNHSEGSFDL